MRFFCPFVSMNLISTTMKIIGYLIAMVLLISCEKESDPNPVTPGKEGEPINVLRDNSGFTTVFDHVQTLTGNAANVPDLGIWDFTLESNNNLNIAFYDYQNGYTTNHRVTQNLTTNEPVDLPAQAETLAFSTVQLAQQGWLVTFRQFRPYSNFFTYAVLKEEQAWPYSRSLEFRGDISGTITKTANPIGIPDMGWRFPALYFATTANNNAFGNFLQGAPTPTYMLSNCFQIPISFGTKEAIVASFLESDYYTYGSYKSFHLRPDSLIAYDYTYNTTNEQSTLTPTTRISVAGVTAGMNNKIKRHYSTDGKVMGMLIENTDTRKFWTYSYNFNTKSLTKGLENAALDFSDVGSDYDLDEFGNVYYAGYAENGANKKAVSIYKKDIGGTVTVIGKDDFIKFGKIVGLRTLMGKVFVVITGKQTNTSTYQLSILKED